MSLSQVPGRSGLLVVAIASIVAGCGGGDAETSAQSEAGPTRVLEVQPDLPLGAAVGADSPSGALNRAIRDGGSSVQLRLAPGVYVLDPEGYEDPSCGNCEDSETPIPATVGVRLTGSAIELLGTHPDSVIIHTGAGYGLLIEDCENCPACTSPVRSKSMMSCSSGPLAPT